jgi:hypothetical protein
LRGQMDKYEETIHSLMSDIGKYNYIELYHEENYIKEQVKNITKDLKEFNIYMPKYQFKVQDIENVVSQIKTDIRDRLQSYFTETDHTFSLQNYEYVLKTHHNPKIASVYKQLGPFDYYQDGVKNDIEGDGTEQKSLMDRFEKRKTGTQFRGEIN